VLRVIEKHTSDQFHLGTLVLQSSIHFFLLFSSLFHHRRYQVAREECGGLELPPNGEFGVGNIFVGAKGNPALKVKQ
jgi:hypothetical protein